MDRYNFSSLNTGVGTYVRRTGELSHLDITLASENLAQICNWSVLNDTWGSDHLPVLTTINEPALIENSNNPRWAYKKANWDAFKSGCKQLITEELVTADIGQSRNNIVETIIKLADIHIPTVKNNKNPAKKSIPYWNSECSQAVKARNNAKTKMQQTKSLDDRLNYFKLKGVAQHVIKNSQKSYWQDYCSSLDDTTKLGSVWKTLKKMNGVRSFSAIPNLTDNGVSCDTNYSKAELFAKTFSDVSANKNLTPEFIKRRADFEIENHKLLNSVDQSDDGDPIINAPFELHELKAALRQCKKNSAPGLDRVSYEILKQIPHRCLNVILKFYNTIWDQGDIPRDWKHSIILPILKPNKSAFEPSSYRPIALTSVLCKVMERLIANRMAWHLDKNNLFNKFQSGFRRGRSCVDHILRLQDEIHKSISNRGVTAGVFIDLEKAFDLVWRDGVLFKLRQLGLSGKVYNFVRNFLSDRSIQVQIGDSLSSIYSLENGSPQGSVLSPLLFIILINDIPESNEGVKLSLFADDSAIWKSGSSIKTILKHVQNYLIEVQFFFEKWGLKISKTKTVAVLFTKRSKIKDELNLKICDTPIRFEKSVKFLGVIFDDKLTWSAHIDYVVDKCKSRLNLMRAISGSH